MTESEASMALNMRDILEAVRKRVAAIEADANTVSNAEEHELLMLSHEKWVKDLLTSSNGLDHLAVIAFEALVRSGDRVGVSRKSVWEDMKQLP